MLVSTEEMQYKWFHMINVFIYYSLQQMLYSKRIRNWLRASICAYANVVPSSEIITFFASISHLLFTLVNFKKHKKYTQKNIQELNFSYLYHISQLVAIIRLIILVKQRTSSLSKIVLQNIIIHLQIAGSNFAWFSEFQQVLSLTYCLPSMRKSKESKSPVDITQLHTCETIITIT